MGEIREEVGFGFWRKGGGRVREGSFDLETNN